MERGGTIIKTRNKVEGGWKWLGMIIRQEIKEREDGKGEV
jgi:hypothetical protein